MSETEGEGEREEERGEGKGETERERSRFVLNFVVSLDQEVLCRLIFTLLLQSDKMAASVYNWVSSSGAVEPRH